MKTIHYNYKKKTSLSHKIKNRVNHNNSFILSQIKTITKSQNNK